MAGTNPHRETHTKTNQTTPALVADAERAIMRERAIVSELALTADPCGSKRHFARHGEQS